MAQAPQFVLGRPYTTAGTPQPILDRLNRELMQIVKSPGFAGRVEPLGFEVRATTRGEFAQFNSDEMKRWGQTCADSAFSSISDPQMQWLSRKHPPDPSDPERSRARGVSAPVHARACIAGIMGS